MKKQLVIVTDMEGASGIFEQNWKAMNHGSEEWRKHGRDLMTSDVKAVCEAANEFGIDEIFLYDAHFAGSPEHNVKIEELPSNVVVADVIDRCFDWRRIRGQVVQNPFGIITVGQHARFGEEKAYFPHTIQSPPIKSVTMNGMHIAEIGQAVCAFNGTRFLANIGCMASMKEAKELSSQVVEIPVKDKSKNWEPSAKETYPLIKQKVLEALQSAENVEPVVIEGACSFEMELLAGFYFQKPEKFAWKGTFGGQIATWETPTIEIGLEIFNYVRSCCYSCRKGG